MSLFISWKFFKSFHIILGLLCLLNFFLSMIKRKITRTPTVKWDLFDVPCVYEVLCLTRLAAVCFDHWVSLRWWWTQWVSIRQLLIGSIMNPMIVIPHWSTHFILHMIFPPPDLQHCECCVTDLNYWSGVPLTPIAHYSTVGPVCPKLWRMVNLQ